ncbi:MAG: peptide-methionine (S)-S-oxide reductase MsrA [Verrucomicrobiota bacterium]
MRPTFLALALLVLGLHSEALADPPTSEKAVLAAGCFWCLEAVLEGQPGVLDAVSGYAGGAKDHPTYRDHGQHAEAVEVTFDPAQISFAALLEVYWNSFDPTDGRGVIPDFGPSYRPILFFLNDEQKRIAEASKAAVQKRYPAPLAVPIEKLDKFWTAEGYHQDFVKRNPEHPYVVRWSYERMRAVGLKTP